MSSVAVFGSSRSGPGTPAYALALELGRALGRRGAEVRCGGYGGVMEAVSRGAREAGGRVVGCTLAWPRETRPGNPYLSEEVPCATLDTRIAALLSGTRAAVVLPGGVGTLNEMFWVWTLLLHGRDADRALVLLGDSFAELLEFLGRRFEVDARVRGLVQVASTVEEAAALACGEVRP